MSADFYGYQKIFSLKFMHREPTEPFFTFLRSINDVLFDSELTSIYFVSAFISLSIKKCAVKKLADGNALFVFILYLFSTFTLHEYNQIRVACSISIFLFMLYDIIRERKVLILLEFCIAFCFHYSAIFILFFLVFIKVFKSKGSLAVLVVFGFFFAVFTSSAKAIVNFIYLIQDVLGFNKSGNVSDFMSPFNLKYLVLLTAFLLYLYFIPPTDKKNMLLAKSMAFGLCFYYYLNPIHLPVISVRLAEYFTSVFVLFFVNTSKYLPFKEKKIIIAIPVTVILFYGYASAKTSLGLSV
ncbi:MAG: EpsG family protein [Bacteroides sp.]|nr:EpsG family protein [Prevotella sp.]MCM1408280.1 EpsG family protein [Treponema brennaborense]MCM1470488.1 EpsG family protein [Bacteroides sp.]